MAKKVRKTAKAKHYFLNEEHELGHFAKGGGGGNPKYVEPNWANVGSKINTSLKNVDRKVKQLRDPLKGQRYFMVALPEPTLTKRSNDKKKAPDGTFEEKTDYRSEMHARVFGRLGLDLLDVTDDGRAIVHAKQDAFTHMVNRTEALPELGIRERWRWITVQGFDVVPGSLRVDEAWLTQLEESASVDCIVELQPLLTNIESDQVLNSLFEVVRGDLGTLRGSGSDFSGRQWLRGELPRDTIAQIAEQFPSVQSLHPPYYSIAASPALPKSRKAPIPHEIRPAGELPCVAVFDTGIPTGHIVLSPYIRGNYVDPGSPSMAANSHGSRVASRVVFGEKDFYSGIEDPGAGTHSILNVRLRTFDDGAGVMIDDKSVNEAMRSIVATFPDVRVFNLSFDRKRPLSALSGIARREAEALIRDLDLFVFFHDVLVVVAAGNSPPNIVPTTPYPRHLASEGWQLGPWASGFNSIVCGAYAGRIGAGALATSPEWPSPFTRIGPGVANAPVPDFSAPGGNATESYAFSPGLGVWVCSDDGHWEDHPGTSYAAPLLAREIASTLQYLSRHCDGETRPYGVLVKALLALVANRPELGGDLATLADRALGRGLASCVDVSLPKRQRALVVWQGDIEGPSDTVKVALPVPETWVREATMPHVRLVVAWDPPVHEAAANLWSCRDVSAKLRPGPNAPAVRARKGRRRAFEHKRYPITEKLWDFTKIREEMSIKGSDWTIELAYGQTADYYPAFAVPPRQRVAFVAELIDMGAGSVDVHAAIQELPAAQSMTRLSMPATGIRTPVVIRSTIG